MPTIAIAAIVAIPKPVMYVSAIDAGGAVGATVGSGASITVKPSFEFDCQYPLVPLKVAITGVVAWDVRSPYQPVSACLVSCCGA